MAFYEGCRRLRTAGQGLTTVGGAMLIVGAFFSLDGVGTFLIISLPVTIIGIVLWIAAWVLEGFVAPSRTDPDRS